MGEAERNRCGDREVGRESVCGSPPAVGGAGGVHESPLEGGGCVLVDRKEGEECEPREALGNVDELLDDNGGVGDWALDESRDAGHAGLENGYLASGGTEMLAVKESACSRSCDGNVASVVVESGLRVLVEEEQVEEGCGGLAGPKEESEHVVLKVEPVVETPGTINKEECSTCHAGLKNDPQVTRDMEVRDGYSVMVDGDDSLGVSVEEVGEGCGGLVEANEESRNLVSEHGPKETFKIVKEEEEFSTNHAFVENGHRVQSNADTTEQVRRSRSPPCDSHGPSVGIRSVLVKENREVDDDCGRFLGAEKESKLLFAEHRTPVQNPKMANEEEHDDFPGLSPLRTLEGDGLRNSSGIEIGLQGEYIAGLFDDIKDCSGCDDALLVSSELTADFPLIKTSEDTSKHGDRFCCPPFPKGCLDASSDCNVMLCSKDGSGEENQLLSLQTGYCLTMEFKGAQKEQRESESESCGPLDGINIPLGGSCQNLVQGSPDEVGSCSVVEGSSSQQSSHPAAENRLSDSSSGPDFLRNDSDACNISSTCCSNRKDSCGQLGDRGMVHPKPVSLIVFRRTNPKRAASSRNNLSEENLDPLSRMRNTSRKCRKANDTNTSISSSTFKISNKVTRKRSCLHRPVRHSVWGEAENILRIFKQNGDLVMSSSARTQIQSRRSKKGRHGSGRKLRQTTQKDGSLRLSKNKCAVSANSVHLKDQTCLQPVFPVVVYSQAKIQTDDNNICPPNLNCNTDSGISSKVEVEHKLAEDRPVEVVKLLQRGGQQGDKDVESTLTQETSVDNMLGECPGVSSRVGSETMVETTNKRHLSDPGSSPDSDIYNPVIDAGAIANEGAASTSPDAGVVPSALVPVPVFQDDVHAAAFSSFKSISSPVSAPSLDIQPKSNTKEGKKAKKGKKGKNGLQACITTCTMSEHPFVEEKLHGLDNLENAGKPLKFSRHKSKKQGCSDEGTPLCLKSIRKATRKASRDKTSAVDSTVLGMVELESGKESTEKEVGSNMWALPGCDVANRESEGGTSGASPLIEKIKGRRRPRSTNSSVRKGSSAKPDSARRGRKDANGLRKNSTRKSGNKSRSKEKSQTPDYCLEVSRSMSSCSGTANKLVLARSTGLSCKTNVGSEVVSGNVSNSGMASIGDELTSNKSSALGGQSLPPRVAWACCDDCHKWRCISAALADTIEETNCRWTCKDNTSKAFADCSIPQEKSNAEINAELEISDVSCDEDFSGIQPSSMGFGTSKLTASQQASWTLVKSNLFLHRNHKTQTIDEIMVCQCKPPLDGSLGCGEACLNRMLNIECVKGTCPCGDICSNQQFQQRKYAEFKWFRCGRKGYGLQLLEDVSQGQFLIEYVGEVLDLASYEARQRYYASRGQKHFYFMTLNGGEVIDACAKGNLGRFINHSCDPNCRTEKWMVNGEVCIGLFAIRDIKKGEEVTFDYNYVRVFGAAAKKCVCGAPECRGYIGGDPLNTEVIVQGDSDDEYPEPVMIQEDGERELDVDETVSDAMGGMTLKHEGNSIESKDLLIQCTPTVPDSEDCQQASETICRPLSDVNSLDASCQTLNPIQTEESMSRPLSDIQSLENSIHCLDNRQIEENMLVPVSGGQPSQISLQSSVATKESASDLIFNRKTPLSKVVDDKQNTLKNSPAKLSRSSSTIKKSRSNAKSLVAPRAKKLATSASSGHLEGVEEKLNELLDEDGGISKRKDATKGYLKLLFVTAAGGDNVGGCASQSMRDLSLILDALLKTKSRTVLVDIINKNGLQMLHNIMKQNRSKFNRIPIIRKLLKVLEFLALKEILTPEHMNQGPPCSGMESFRDSILSLTRHNDVQVHQIARNFRDKWIPRTIKRVEPSDRDDGQLDPQRSYRSWFESSVYRRRHDHVARHTDAIICVSEAVQQPASSSLVDIPGEISSHPGQLVSGSAPMVDNNTSGRIRTRKRKSRWDQPSDITASDPRTFWPIEDHTAEPGTKFIKANSQSELDSQLEESKKDFGTQREENSSFDEVANVKSPMQQNLDDEAPPGFGSPRKDHHPQISFETSVATVEVAMGCLQERFFSHRSVSYGIPLTLMQQLGSSEVGGNQSQSHWLIAPGMPFHPFPPLPPYPRGTHNPTSPAQSFSDHNMTHAAKETQLTKRQLEGSQTTDPNVPSISGERLADTVESRPRSSHITERVRWPSNSSGRRFFRPQRWNNQRFQRGWLSWPREGNGHGHSCSKRNGDSGVGVGNPRDGSGLCSLESVRNADVSSNFHQPPHNN